MKQPNIFARISPVAYLLLVLLSDMNGPAALSSPSGPIAVSTMDLGPEEWTVGGGATEPEHISAGGASGGYISASDEIVGPRWQWIAPASFLGDVSASYKRALNYYLKQSTLERQVDVQQDVLLAGASMEIYFDAAHNPGSGWTLYSVPLDARAGWRHAVSHRPVTDTEMQAVLGALAELRLEGDYSVGLDTTALDEVVLGGELVRPQAYLPVVSR